jgi:hypothetical protein
MSQALQYYLFTDEPSADACPPVVDAALGYPAPGVDYGSGIHVPPGDSITQTYALVLANAGQTEWAYPADANTTAALAASPPTIQTGGEGGGKLHTGGTVATVNLPAPGPLDDTFTSPVVLPP